MVESYIPSPKDDTLGDFEYYVKKNENVYRVEIVGILPFDDETRYTVVTSSKRKPVRSWRKHGEFSMCELYDNKQDCKWETHPAYNYWEKLRQIQEEEHET